jgi:hypothetical protein
MEEKEEIVNNREIEENCGNRLAHHLDHFDHSLAAGGDLRGLFRAISGLK